MTLQWRRVSPLLSIFLHIDLTHFTSIREAWIIFKAGRNRDGYFDANDLLKQVNNTIDIFEGLTKGWAQGLFLFDNMPSHQKCALDAISARCMVKGPLTISASHHHCCTHTGPNKGGTRTSPSCIITVSGRHCASVQGKVLPDAQAPLCDCA